MVQMAGTRPECVGFSQRRIQRYPQSKAPRSEQSGACVLEGCLTMTYFRTGTPYYHRRTAVSRSCSGWEGVGPAGYGRQALRGESAGYFSCVHLVACTQLRSLSRFWGSGAHHDGGCRAGSVNARWGRRREVRGNGCNGWLYLLARPGAWCNDRMNE